MRADVAQDLREARRRTVLHRESREEQRRLRQLEDALGHEFTAEEEALLTRDLEDEEHAEAQPTGAVLVWLGLVLSVAAAAVLFRWGLPLLQGLAR